MKIYDKTCEAIIGLTSLVGILSNDYPLKYGNYFGLTNGLRIVNFWAENFAEATQRFLLDGKVKVKVFEYGSSKIGLIDDSRIPDNWYNKDFCFTGHYRPSQDLLDEISKYLKEKNETSTEEN